MEKTERAWERNVAKNMLVVDDDPIVLRACERVFKTEGYTVVIESSPQKAMDMVQDIDFEVILCDWNLGKMDGLDLLEILDKRSPQSAIVMISGYPAIERATEAMRRGAADYVAKPFSPEEIIEAVKKAVRFKKSKSRE